VAWGAGANNSGSSPDFVQSQVPSGLSNVVAIAAGMEFSLALLQQPTMPTPGLALSRGMSGLELPAYGVSGISWGRVHAAAQAQGTSVGTGAAGHHGSQHPARSGATPPRSSTCTWSRGASQGLGDSRDSGCRTSTARWLFTGAYFRRTTLTKSYIGRASTEARTETLPLDI
jgi:hypothetical protein